MQVVCSHSTQHRLCTPLLLTGCSSWWCSVGDAVATAVFVALRAAETGLKLTGDLQEETHNLLEWSNLQSAAHLRSLAALSAFSHLCRWQRPEHLPLLSRRSVLSHTVHSTCGSGDQSHIPILNLLFCNCHASMREYRCLQRSYTDPASVPGRHQKLPSYISFSGQHKFLIWVASQCLVGKLKIVSS